MTTFAGHFLGPDTHAARPATTGLPEGTMYVCTTHNKIEKIVAAAWADYATLGGASTGGAKLYDYTVAGSDKATIDTNVDGTTVANFSGYDTLELLMILRTDQAGAVDFGFRVNVNNDSSALYDYQYHTMNNATSGGGVAALGTYWPLMCHGSGGTASYASPVRIVIPGYAGTTFFKAGIGDVGVLDNTAGSNYDARYALGYRSTSAITRIKLALAAGNFKVGSRLTVYGR